MSELSVENFRAILRKETSSLEKKIEHWSNVLETIDGDDVDGSSGTIRSTIGQAKLLITQRFKQFSKLIDGCEFNTGPMPTRLDDLLGFWEMISFQVEDVKKKFESLNSIEIVN